MRTVDGLFVRVLGPIGAEFDGVPLRLGSPQCRAVFALLVLRRNALVSTDQLIESLWLGRPPTTARAQIHNRVSALRRAVSAPGEGSRTTRLESVGTGYRLWLEDGRLDLDLFQAQLRVAEDQWRTGQPSAAAATFRSALDGWTGPAFSDVDARAVRQAANHLADLRLAAVERWIAAESAAGPGPTLIFELARLVAEHPFHERFQAHLMSALARSGRSVEALAAYRDARIRLADELGIEPSEALQALHRAILAGRSTTRSDWLEVG